jgi:hypothetical protein
MTAYLRNVDRIERECEANNPCQQDPRIKDRMQKLGVMLGRKKNFFIIGIEALKAFDTIKEYAAYVEDNYCGDVNPFYKEKMAIKDDILEQLKMMEDIYFQEPISTKSCEAYSVAHQRGHYGIHHNYLSVKNACAYLVGIVEPHRKEIKDYSFVLRSFDFIVEKFAHYMGIPFFIR